MFPADDPRPGAQADLLRILQLQGCEISRATAPFTVTVPVPRRRSGQTERRPAARQGRGGHSAEQQPQPDRAPNDAKPTTEPRTFPAGSYVVRMDQPYSRIADTLLDYQYWAPDDPQKHPYDDTGWTFGELFNVQVARVTDAKVLDAADGAGQRDRCTAPGGVAGSGAIFAVNHNADTVAGHAALSLQGRAVRGGRGAVRGGRAQVQPRLVLIAGT